MYELRRMQNESLRYVGVALQEFVVRQIIRLHLKFELNLISDIQSEMVSFNVTDWHVSNPWRPSFIENGQIVWIHCLAYHPIDLFGA